MNKRSVLKFFFPDRFLVILFFHPNDRNYFVLNSVVFPTTYMQKIQIVIKIRRCRRQVDLWNFYIVRIKGLFIGEEIERVSIK